MIEGQARSRPRPGRKRLDLAGGPTPSHAPALADYVQPFRRARDLDLGRTVQRVARIDVTGALVDGSTLQMQSVIVEAGTITRVTMRPLRL